MSGGVDSSVSAALLKEQGHEVIGLFMKNWDQDDDKEFCPAAQDYEDAMRVCDKLQIPFYSVNFAKEYWDKVFKEFIDGLEKGYTPNPDILCNREIKFHYFFDYAINLDADYLATGHYCRKGYDSDGKATLLKGLDPQKDQSYFLHAINGQRLDKVLFPIGDIQKSEVRRLATDLDLITKDKKDSTGICFIGERKFTPFLAKYVSGKEGEFQQLDGQVVGVHKGHQFYTIGQRKGLGLGGPGQPWFVVKKDSDKNIIYVERGDDHPALYGSSLEAVELSWIGGANPLKDGDQLKAKIRYRQQDQACRIRLIADRLLVDFDKPQRAITPWQSIVFYQDDKCLGGGLISPNNYLE